MEASLFDKYKNLTPTKEPSPFEEAVHKTSKLIGRSYMQTFKLVAEWPLHKIERRYKEAIDCSPLTKPAIRWWSLRKRDQSLGGNENKV